MAGNRTVDFKAAKRAMIDAGWIVTRSSARYIEWEGPDGNRLKWSHLAAQHGKVPIRFVIGALGHNPFGRQRASVPRAGF